MIPTAFQNPGRNVSTSLFHPSGTTPAINVVQAVALYGATIDAFAESDMRNT